MRPPLEDVVALARRDFGVDASRRVDWDRIDQSLFARIEQEQKQEQALRLKLQDRRWAYFGSAAVAAAATLGILLGWSHEPSSVRPGVTHADSLAGRIAEVRGDGSVVINGVGATPGASVRLGDGVETRGAEATLVREGAANIVIEPNSRLLVRQVSGTLVLSLERGALEARVMPVSAGEAFAVDVADSRIAVHGTVLRVARVGDHAAVDLVEGVVSVGPAPRFGQLLGSLITAPAHVEFSIADAVKTLNVSHDPSLVRSVPLSAASATAVPTHLEEPERSLRSRSESSPLRPPAPAVSPGHLDGRSPAPNVQGATTPEVGANESVEAAVVTCMRERPRAENVTVVVSTTLYLDVGDDGAVRSARFDPPVLPEVNGCAAAAIYKTHFPHAGAVAIPIEFKN
jgi:ferric-dicitrate binding protein FerR (iron transport regulator)